jgi:hypothetical protein
LVEGCQTIRIREWYGVEQRAVDNTEDGRIGTDAKRQRRNRHACEYHVLAELAKGIAQILRYRFEELPAPQIPASFTEKKIVSELSSRYRRRAGHTRLAELLGAKIAM